MLDDFVAVVADHMWAAKQGLDALDVTWDEGPNAQVTTDRDLERKSARPASRRALSLKSLAMWPRDSPRANCIEAMYHMPFLAHATMEPMNCTVHVKPDGCEIWVGIQVSSRAQAIAAKVTGLPLDKVIVHNHLLGGGFGRTARGRRVAKSVRIAQKVDGPVKVIWTREEDIQHDFYRPFYFDRFEASLSGGKSPAGSTAWPGRPSWHAGPRRRSSKGIDSDAVEGAVGPAVRHAQSPRGIRSPGAAGYSDLLLARRRTQSQYLRD